MAGAEWRDCLAAHADRYHLHQARQFPANVTHPGRGGYQRAQGQLRVITSAKLPIGRDGRNRPSIFPFGTATGRNAHSKSLFNAHAGMRSFMVAPPGKILAYLDWRTQEVAVAAARSQDPALLAAYRGGDVYHTLAVTSGLTNEPDQRRWKTRQSWRSASR